MEISLKDIDEASLGRPFYVEQVTPTSIRVVDVNGTPRLEVSYTGSATMNGIKVTDFGTYQELRSEDGSFYSEGRGVTAQFYHHFEVRAGRPYRGMTANALAWANLVLTNAGIAAASMLMILAGLLGDMAVSPGEISRSGMTVKQAAEQVLNPFIVPVSVALLVAVAGAAAGGAGFVVSLSSITSKDKSAWKRFEPADISQDGQPTAQATPALICGSLRITR